MNIKGLLLGSAAAMVAVSGARAADAIVYAEPEPVEYVRVCDMYGSGFFYIPGTETCLSISGYVWYQMGATNADDGDTPSKYFFADDGWNKSTRARVNFDARSDTEWGTLRAYIRFQASWGDRFDGPVSADQAFLELGGFRAGYTESAWVDSQGAGVAVYGSHSWDGMFYGDQQRHLVAYTFDAGNGLTATLSLEDDDNQFEDNYMPDIVGVVAYNQAWGGIWGKVGYDEEYNILGDSGYGAQLGAQFNVPNAPGSSFRLLGFYADSDNDFGTGARDGVLFGSPEWSVLASYQHQFSPSFAASVGAQYSSDHYIPGTDISTGDDSWNAEAVAVWTPVQNFEVRAEYGYWEYEDLDASHSGYLRFTRSF